MKRKLCGLVAALCLTGFHHTSFADEFKDNINQHLNQPAMDALAKDLGALMAGGSFHQAKALGFPLGVDVGIHGAVVGINDDNPILRDNGSTWGSIFGQVEVGLPAKIDVIARGGSLGSGAIWGGGLRYGILKTDLPGLPNISVSALGHQMKHDYLKVTTYSANLVASFNIPFIHPYVGVGVDITKTDPTSKAYVGAPGGTDPELEGKADGYRAEAGINISLIPFTYIALGGGLANGKEMVRLGLGAKF